MIPLSIQAFIASPFYVSGELAITFSWRGGRWRVGRAVGVFAPETCLEREQMSLEKIFWKVMMS
jgi:hypothetical protein